MNKLTRQKVFDNFLVVAVLLFILLLIASVAVNIQHNEEPVKCLQPPPEATHVIYCREGEARGYRGDCIPIRQERID